MATRIALAEAQARLTELVAGFCDVSGPVIIEQEGQAVAVLLGPEAYERYHQYVMDQFREAVAEIRRRNAHEDPDEVYRVVTEVVEEVRQEQYEREHSR